MQVFQSQDYFPDINPHRLLRKVIPLVQMSEHLSSAHIVCIHTHTQTDTQGASIDMIQILHKQNIMPTNRHTSMDTNIKKTSIQHFKTDEKGRESNHSPRMRCSLLCV